MYMQLIKSSKKEYISLWQESIKHVTVLIIQSEVKLYAKHFITILIFDQYMNFIQTLQLEDKINAGILNKIWVLNCYLRNHT